MTYNYGGNVLASEPIVFLTSDTILVYRKNKYGMPDHLNGKDFIQIASVMLDRYATWTFYIVENDYDFSLIIDNERGWRAFSEIPELFQFLTTLKLKNLTLKDIVLALEVFGAVEQLE